MSQQRGSRFGKFRSLRLELFILRKRFGKFRRVDHGCEGKG
jgi:hypothetical protein